MLTIEARSRFEFAFTGFASVDYQRRKEENADSYVHEGLVQYFARRNRFGRSLQ
jgi:hypothetical protein